MIWFTADTHFGHENIIRFCDRPFGSVAEMNEALIDNWNAVVGPRDEVWHLGDFAFKADPAPFWNCLNGRKHFIFGNHDDSKKILTLCPDAGDTHYLRHDGHRIFLSHYAHRVWRNSHHEAMHLYGHSHGELPGIGRSMDVGVDAVEGYRPISIDEVVARLADEGRTNHHPVRNAATEQIATEPLGTSQQEDRA